MSETKEQLPATEQLINEDGVLDEKAAGAAIDKVIEQTKKENIETLKENTQPTSDEKIPDEGGDSNGNEKPAVDDWVNSEEMQELIESLGYTNEDALNFSKKEDFETHVRLVDKKSIEEQELALDLNDESEQRDLFRERADKQHRKNGKFAKKDDPLPTLDPDEFDEQLIEVMEARDAKIAELEARLNDAGNDKVLKQFDTIVDNMGHEDLFGHSDNLNESNKGLRDRLFEEYKEIYNILEARGKPVTGKRANETIVKRAFNLEFADEIKKSNRQKLSKKVRKQSKRITGSNAGLRSDHYDGDVTKDPVLHKLFNEFTAENG